MGHKLIEELRVAPGSGAQLGERDAGARVGAADKTAGLARLEELVVKLGGLHDRMLAEATDSLLLVLQGMDASGKDGTIHHVLSGVNPAGCRIVSFREPSTTELAHDFLWRIHQACPARGEIGIFNRSHYEDVVAVRVRKLVPESTWRPRFEHIRSFEQMLTDEGTTVVKVFLHLSRDEQRKRLQERIDDPAKRWKFRLGDLDDRKLWDDFQEAWSDAIRETSTASAPWYVVPADHNWSRNLAVAEILVATLEQLDPRFPPSEPGLDGLEVT